MHRIGNIVREIHDLRLGGELSLRLSLSSPLKDLIIIGVGTKFCPPTGVDLGALHTPRILHSRQEAGAREVQTAGNTVLVMNFGLQPHQQSKCLGVALKTAAITRPFGQGAFAVMPEGRVTDVVGKTRGFDHVSIQTEPRGKLPPDLRHFERVRQTIARKIQSARG